jgi:protein-S-isoprenylcysteine O-methyltransferase Ste14
MLLRRIIARSLVQTLVFAALLFGPAGTLLWPRAWIFFGVLAVASVWMIAALYPKHKAILEKRLEPPFQPGQPPLDKILVGILLVTLLGATALIPLDVFHWHLLPAPPFAISLLGLALFLFGGWLTYRTLVENSFAALAVRHQGRQRVIDTGVYSVVRHPMYAGASLFCLGMALWLGSTAATLAMLAPILTLAVRSVFEERFLRRELDGYADYTRRVRWRLVPSIW